MQHQLPMLIDQSVSILYFKCDKSTSHGPREEVTPQHFLYGSVCMHGQVETGLPYFWKWTGKLTWLQVWVET